MKNDLLLNTRMREVLRVHFCADCYVYTVAEAGERCEMCKAKRSNLLSIDEDRMKAFVILAIFSALCLAIAIAVAVKVME